MNNLRLSNLPTSFPLNSPLEYNERFLKWKTTASQKDITDLFIRSMHDQKILYYVHTDKTVKIPVPIYSNLQYLARLSGFSVDLQVAAKEIACKEKYTACITEPQKLPIKDQEFINYHSSRNNFSSYDGLR